jgi:hypothetical protein
MSRKSQILKEIKSLVKEYKSLNEGFTKKEQEQVADVVKKLFDEKGNNAVRDYDTLNNALGRLNFEVDASDIEIGGWTATTFDRRIKSAKVYLQGKYITLLQN